MKSLAGARLRCYLAFVRRVLFMLAGLVLITIAIYWPVFHFPFINFDDPDYVSGNPYVRSGFTRAGIHHALNTYAMGNWNPLLWISFYIDGALFHARPGAMHVENVVLHLMAGLLLWRLLSLAAGSINRSYIVAALFICHPMHVESVAWISERKDVLSTPILFAAMLAYLHYCNPSTRHSRWIAYLAMIALFICSMLVKTMGVTLPAVLLLLDYWPLKRTQFFSWTKLVVEKIPLLLLSIFFSIISGIAQQKTGATSSLSEISLLNRVGNATVCYVIYFAKLVVPRNLAVHYPHPGSRPMSAVFAAAVLLTLLTYFAFRGRKRAPYAIVGWFWFLGTLVPVIGLVQVGGQAMADRYSYLPSVGLFVAITWSAVDLFRRYKVPKKISGALAATVITIFTIAAHIQAAYWQSTEALFTHAMAVSDDSAVVHVELGAVAYEKKDIHRAVNELNLALANGRQFARADFALGNCWEADDPVKACTYYRKAVLLEPHNVMYHIKYAQGLRLAAQKDETMRQSDLNDAKAQIQAAIDLDPDDQNAREELKKITDEKP